MPFPTQKSVSPSPKDDSLAHIGSWVERNNDKPHDQPEQAIKISNYQVYNELKKDTKAEEYLQSGRQGQVDIRSGHGNPTERWLMQSSTEDPWTIYTAEGAGKKD